ncbi:HesA/MoeB/ThiF family protein [Anaeromicrobium sediminis]|uniref:Molybdopterin biosynthesis protein MoeB n=1 Tax=Anaeromicrobium sediminis TaxID=1478221 RepID=A0A267MK93_9FIRM|nr:HesA/MoeB/ThiF family protein [Anaeromicrobium sediminis]PAB59867.1 molybdopterin biosynthesis protein MoeB [Anaeromicrobium sediminis]
MERYERNMSMLSEDENKKLSSFKVCVVGSGGLGGYVIEMLGRLGIGHITAVDSDVFDETNLNRQILSTKNTIGKSKVMVAKERMDEVNDTITLNPIYKRLDGKNGEEILKGHDLVIDALDSIDTRLLLQHICKELGIPLIHGAIAGWYGQVCTILPGDDTLNIIYKKSGNGLEKKIGNPSFTPALVASIQVSEALKVLMNKGELIRKKLLYIDLLENEYITLNLE